MSVIFIKPNSISAADVLLLKESGYKVIEHPNPDEVKIFGMNNLPASAPPVTAPKRDEKPLNTENFTRYISQHLEKSKSQMRKESWYTYRSQVSKLLKFKNPIQFCDLDEKFINDYREFMLNTLGNNENTASKSLRSLRTFVNIAIRYKQMADNPFKYIRIKKVDGKREALSIDELKKLSDAYNKGDLKCEMESEIMRYFLFACYTGLRYSDLKGLCWQHIRDGKIQMSMQKTSHSVNIPLSEKALALLPTQDGENVFRIYCNKVTNRYLRGIGKRFKIESKLTCHVARHTFATVSITKGIPMEIVSKLLGHTDLKTTQIYAKITDGVKEKEMTKWNDL